MLLGGGGGGELHEMDRSSLRIFPPPFTAGGRLFCQVSDEMFNDAWNMVWQSYVTSHGLSQVSHQKAEIGWGLFCHLNQSCWKLHEMDRSRLRTFFLFCHLGGGGCWLSASWTKVTGNCMEWIDPVSEFFPSFTAGGGGGFSARFPMRCSMMHEIWFGKVTSHYTVWAEYLTKRQRGGGGLFGWFEPTWGLGDWST